MSNLTTLRETEDFLLEEMGHEVGLDRKFWLTNRSQYNFDDTREHQFNRWNQGIMFEQDVMDLLECETDALFNARCLGYFNCSRYEAAGYYGLTDDEMSGRARHDETLLAAE